MDNRLRERGYQSKGAGYTPEGKFYQPCGRNEHPLGPATVWPTGVSDGLSTGGGAYRDNADGARISSPKLQNQKAGILK